MGKCEYDLNHQNSNPQRFWTHKGREEDHQSKEHSYEYEVEVEERRVESSSLF